MRNSGICPTAAENVALAKSCGNLAITGMHCSPVVFTHQPGQHEGNVFTVALGGTEEQTRVVWHNLQHQGQEVVRVHLMTFFTVL